MSTLFVGIDIAKKSFVVAACTKEGLRRKPRTFGNHLKGFEKCFSWLQELSQNTKTDDFHICLESTGVYGVNLARYFHELPQVTVSMINPAQIHAFARTKLSRNKTDAVDALLIADYAATQKPPLWHPTPLHLEHLQAMVRRIQSLEKLRREELNRLDALKCLSQPQPLVIQSLQETLANIEAQIKRLKKACLEHINQHPDLKKNKQLLTSIPGIGETTACLCLAELGDGFTKLKVKQLVAHCGLSPRHYLSGSSVCGKTRISKVGRTQLRKGLYFPAMVAVKYNPVIKIFYLRLLKAGKAKKQALVACMRKLLHIIYGVIKNQKPFDPQLAFCS